MARFEVARLVIPEHVEDHIWERHHITRRQVLALISHRYIVVRNHGAAPYRLIGRDEQGRCIASPIAPTDDPLTWRAVSAWYCDRDEQTRLTH
jgi:hypothetical protein